MSFDKAKRLLWARSHGHCEGCRATAPLDPHHRQPRGMGGVHGVAKATSNDVRNLVALCRVCHDGADHRPGEARARGLLVPHPVPAHDIPALIHTPQGHGWWHLLADGTFRWCDPEEAQVTLGMYGLA